MDAKALFFERYAEFQDYVSFLLMELTDEQIRTAPDPAVNPIAWTLWHITRAEDLGVNRLAVDGKQVLDDGWTERRRCCVCSCAGNSWMSRRPTACSPGRTRGFTCMTGCG